MSISFLFQFLSTVIFLTENQLTASPICQRPLRPQDPRIFHKTIFLPAHLATTIEQVICLFKWKADESFPALSRNLSIVSASLIYRLGLLPLSLNSKFPTLPGPLAQLITLDKDAQPIIIIPIFHIYITEGDETTD
ncbi:hypothetical protein BT96DRAFT_348276 [Gymnopus androsaceus JB14]|uniref:Uncharacterized protein n=1 Tax=Gymnopus androsaceus JB14 TaxID=1447944 RepID=A0A6A4I920_9AGAR|nr:hypothetical protein BT96DRAFT_348276 [Gymnopus androsaceus JB14]